MILINFQNSENVGTIFDRFHIALQRREFSDLLALPLLLTSTYYSILEYYKHMKHQRGKIYNLFLFADQHSYMMT